MKNIRPTKIVLTNIRPTLYKHQSNIRSISLFYNPLNQKLKYLVYQISYISFLARARAHEIQIEGLIVKLESNLKLGFLYCRSAPTDAEIKAIKKYFDICDSLMGDFNLSHRLRRDQEKLRSLCQN